MNQKRNLHEVKQSGIPPASVQRLLVQYAADLSAKAADLAELAANLSSVQPERKTEEPDRWLTKVEAAKFLNVDPEWFKGKNLPFAKHFGHRTVRYSRNGMIRWASIIR